MNILDVSLWKNGKLDEKRVVICDKAEYAKELYKDLTDALHEMMRDEDDDA